MNCVYCYLNNYITDSMSMENSRLLKQYIGILSMSDIKRYDICGLSVRIVSIFIIIRIITLVQSLDWALSRCWVINTPCVRSFVINLYNNRILSGCYVCCRFVPRGTLDIIFVVQLNNGRYNIGILESSNISNGTNN